MHLLVKCVISPTVITQTVILLREWSRTSAPSQRFTEEATCAEDYLFLFAKNHSIFYSERERAFKLLHKRSVVLTEYCYETVYGGRHPRSGSWSNMNTVIFALRTLSATYQPNVWVHSWDIPNKHRDRRTSRQVETPPFSLNCELKAAFSSTLIVSEGGN